MMEPGKTVASIIVSCVEAARQNPPKSWNDIKTQYESVPVKTVRELRSPISVSVDSVTYTEVAKALKEGLGVKRVHFSLMARLSIFLAYIRQTEQLKPETVGNDRLVEDDLALLAKVIETLRQDEGEFRLKLLDIIHSSQKEKDI